MPRSSTVKFRSVLICDPPEKGWHYISVEGKYAEKFERNGGTRRVICTLNDTETFPCALMPYKGTYFVMVNKERRDRLGISPGDKVRVVIAADESKYGMPMPAELKEVLRQDKDGRRWFEVLKPGRRRSMMYYIAQRKDTDARVHAALIFVEHIKRNEGVIVSDELRRELKRPNHSL